MKKLFALCLLAALLAGCAGTPDASQSQPEGDSSSTAATSAAVTFTDSLGREVTVDRPRRVAVLIGSFTDIWCLAGGQEQLVASAGDAWTGLGLELGPEVADLGGVKEINTEVLFASQPDFVIVSSNTQTDMLELLEGAGLNAAFFQVSTFEEYLDMLDICTRITGCRENYERYGAAVQAQVDAARARADGSAPTVLYVRATGSSCKVKNSQDSVLGEMLADLGCVNIADSETGLLEELSLEVILARDPDFVFAVVQGSDPTRAQDMLDKTLLSNPAWQSLTAVKEGRFHVMEHRLYNLKPNAYWGDAYENLANILYP